MAMRTDQVGSFVARDEEGREYTIHILTYTVSVGNRSDPNAEREGMTSSLRTSDGQPVNRLAKGKYEMLHPVRNVRLTSEDPNAP
jgi:hypothetical protein